MGDWPMNSNEEKTYLRRLKSPVISADLALILREREREKEGRRETGGERERQGAPRGPEIKAAVKARFIAFLFLAFARIQGGERAKNSVPLLRE